MQIAVEIAATADHCSVTCRFLGWSGSNHICRAFIEPGRRVKPRSVRILRDDFLRYERCQQCKDATVPNA